MMDRRAAFSAALGFASLEPREPELRLLHQWLDSWSAVGHVIAGTAQEG